MSSVSYRANSSTGCVIGGNFSLEILLPTIDINKILLITNISSETLSQTEKRFIAFSPLRLAHVQKKIFIKTIQMKRFFSYTK